MDTAKLKVVELLYLGIAYSQALPLSNQVDIPPRIVEPALDVSVLLNKLDVFMEAKGTLSVMAAAVVPDPSSMNPPFRIW